MQDLTLVGITVSGDHLELSDADGRRYLLPLDEALRSVLRDPVPARPVAAASPAVELRPKEIQTRIRAGRTAEEIAQDTGMPLERIRRFEGPVLAEREFMANQARGVRLRHAARSGSAPTLDEQIVQRLPGVADLEWDAWREENGAWVVCLAHSGPEGTLRAHWTYDAQLRHVTPRDDRARLLTEEERPDPVDAVPPRRLAPVRQEARARYGSDRVYDVEADPTGRTAQDRSATVRAAAVDLLDTLRERRGRRQPPLTAEEEARGVPDDPLETAVENLRGVPGRPRRNGPARPDEPARPAQGLDPDLVEELVERLSDEMLEPPAAHPPRSRPRAASDAEVLVLPDAAETSGPAGGRRPGRDHEERGEQPAAESPQSEGTVRSRPTAKRNRRASVPSWDDIVFGARRE